jgi:reactive intermediate/imine deaminase
MQKKIIKTKNAPAAIGTYSQAILVDKTLYLSGQIPLDPENGNLVTGDIKRQIRRVFENLKAVCEAADADLQNIVKLNVYLTDLSYFEKVNEVMAEYFNKPYPARAAVGVRQLPKNSEVEMDAVAFC